MNLKFIRVVILAIAGLLLAPVAATPAFGQNPPYPQAIYDAANYGTWAIQSQQANIYSFLPVSTCIVPVNGVSSPIFAFATNAPVWISDVTVANSEVVTPSAISQTSASCGITISPANQHITFQLRSGTGGLQEALNALSGATQPFPATIQLSRSWFSQASSIPGVTPYSIIANAKGTAKAILVDITTAPFTYYTWNATSTQYVVNGGGAPPTLAVTGAGAGTGPSATSIVGNASQGTIKFTTGTTPTVSAAVFTIAQVTPANGGPGYAQACTFTSIGANKYATGTSAAVFTTIDTVTFTASSTALAASTAYVFNYTCR